MSYLNRAHERMHEINQHMAVPQIACNKGGKGDGLKDWLKGGGLDGGLEDGLKVGRPCFK